MSDDRYKGQEIIRLLKRGLDTESLVEIVQKYYQPAERRMVDEVGTAIDHCQAALERLKDSTDPNAPYSRGKFYLLLASIYLNENRDLKLAEENCDLSIEQFKSRQLSHLEALAYLASAITKRKLDSPDEAIISLDRAKKSVNLESIYRVDKSALDDLRKAIEEENLNIADYFATEEEEPQEPQKESVPTEKQLSVFQISAGQRCVATGGTADLNLLSFGDYEYDTPSSPEVIIDLTKCLEARHADYILEIDVNVNQVKSGLNKGDWLLIKSKNTPNSLTGKRVAILIKERGEIWTSLKIFSSAEDHYFLKTQSKDDASILIASYKSQNLSRIIDYYEGYGEVNKKYVYDVQVSGEVIKRIPRASIKDVTKPTMWRIPILSDIVAGVDAIVEDEVEDYLDFLDPDEFCGAHFGVRVVGDSMKDFGMTPLKKGRAKESGERISLPT